MAEVTGLVTSVVTLVDVVDKAIEYIRQVKESQKEA